MNILIVNAYGRSPNNKNKFISFCSIIKNILKKVSENSGIDNFNFIYRTPITINDFIYNYESNPGEETKENLITKKKFDKIDMIFIDGNEKYLPWGDKGYRLSEFIRLCKATNKILFAAGVALEILIYYLATGSNNFFNFINSKGEIQAIEEIEKIPLNFLKNLKKNDYFLDFVTGDILEYHIINKNWTPIMNIGLHKHITAEKYMSRGKFILPDYFRGKDFNQNNKTIVSNCHELYNFITRQYLSHYLVESLPNEFVGYTSLTWFPHFFNVFYRKYHFKAICQSDKGITVIEHENSVGVAFHPQANYRETIVLMENFIRQKFKEVHEKIFAFKDNISKLKKDEIPLMFKNYKYNDEEKKRMYLSKNFSELSNKIYSKSIGNVDSSIAFNRIKKVKNVASHVGLGFNNRDMIFVENNSIIQKPLSLHYINNYRNKNKENKDGVRYDFFSLKRNENTRISEIFKPYNSSFTPLKTINNETKYENNMMKRIDELKKEIENSEKNMDYLTFIKREKMDEGQLISYYKKTRRNICQKLEEIENLSKYKSNSFGKKLRNYKKNKSKLRLKSSFSFNVKLNNKNSILKKEKYKTIDYENIGNILTENNNIDKMEAEYRALMRSSSSRPVKTAVLSKNKKYLINRNYSVDNKDKINLNDKWKKYENLSLEEIQRKEFLESKKKWISKEDFHRVFGVRSTSIKPIPSVMIFGKPVSSHKYRDIFPEKWITPNGFI